VLGVIRFERLEDAIAIVNETGYGLTSGLQSLDDREQALWRDRIRAGNLYLNKPTVGAIVLRQPIGGEGKSAIGPALKDGGPTYVSQFLAFRPKRSLNRGVAIAEEFHPFAQVCPDVALAIANYAESWRDEFSREHDHFHLLGEDNLRRYLPIHGLRLRLTAADSILETYARVAAARIAGCRCIVSSPPGVDVHELEQLTEAWGGAIEFLEETDDDLAVLIRTGEIERIRFAAPDRVPPLLRAAAAETGLYLADRPVLPEGRLELLHYLREQSISFAWHRYGNLAARATERV
jgi:RHH-type proline utilization regulon transcriptional repressor/proline dehydrogenase/delta 1-pyrroline-5-carboxylate dehydrogenase